MLHPVQVLTHPFYVQSVGFLPDGGGLLSGHGNGTILIWAANNVGVLQRVEEQGPRNTYCCGEVDLAFSPVGGRLAIGLGSSVLVGKVLRNMDEII